MTDIVDRLRRHIPEFGPLSDFHLDALEASDILHRLIAALTPSGDTKAAYMGEVKDADFRNRPVSWTAIKEVMALIRKEGGL